MTDLPQLRRATAADSPAALALVTAVLAEYGLKADACRTDADLADFEAHYFARGGDFVVLVASPEGVKPLPLPSAGAAARRDPAAPAACESSGLTPLGPPLGPLVGTCGLYPVDGAVVELRKMYLAPAWRGRGQGRRLLEWALTRARELGFRRMTLETARVLKEAIALYERNGFRPDVAGLHSCRCDTGYARDL